MASYMFRFSFRSKKKKRSSVVQPQGGLIYPKTAITSQGDLPAVLHRVKRPQHIGQFDLPLPAKKRLFFANPPRFSKDQYAQLEVPVDTNEKLISIQHVQLGNVVLYGEGSPAPGTQVVARQFINSEGQVDENIMQVITFKRKDSGRKDMPESHNEIEVLDVGYMFKSDLEPEEKFKMLSENEPLFTQLPSINDIQQSWMGDCFLLASLNAILALDYQPNDHLSHSGAEFIENMMVREGDDIVVRLYDPRTLRPHYIRVKAAIHMKEGVEAHDHKSYWVHAIEVAYAVFAMTSAEKNKPGLNLDNDEIVVIPPSFLSVFGSGGVAKNTLTILTGIEATYVPINRNMNKLNPLNPQDITLLTAKLTPLVHDLLDASYDRLFALAKLDIQNKDFSNFNEILDEVKNAIITNESTMNWVDQHVRRMLMAKIADNDQALLREWGTYFLVLQYFYPDVFNKLSERIKKAEFKNLTDYENLLTSLIQDGTKHDPDFPLLPNTLQVKFCDYLDQNYKPEDVLINYVASRNSAKLSFLQNLADDDRQNKKFKNLSCIIRALTEEIDPETWDQNKVKLFGIFECLNEDLQLVKALGVYLYALYKYYPEAYAFIKPILEKVPTTSEEANAVIQELKDFHPHLPKDVLTKITEAQTPHYHVENKICQFLGPIGSGRYRLEDYELFHNLQNALTTETIVTAGTRVGFKDVPGLRSSHEYTVTKVQKKHVNGKELLLVTLRNPWNAVGRACDFSVYPVKVYEDPNLAEFTIDLADLIEYFDEYTLGKLPAKQKLQDEVSAENMIAYQTVVQAKSFGSMTDNEKQSWLNTFYQARKQIRDGHLMDQLHADSKNIWEIGQYIDRTITLEKMAINSEDTKTKLDSIDKKVEALNLVNSYRSLIENQEQNFKEYNKKANEDFNKGYKQFETNEERNMYIARLLIVEGGIRYHISNQGIEDLYTLIKDLKEKIVSQKAQIKSMKDKKGKSQLENTIYAEQRLLTILKSTFQERVVASQNFEVMNLNAQRHLLETKSFKKSFVRGVKLFFNYDNDEDIIFKLYTRHKKYVNRQTLNKGKDQLIHLNLFVANHLATSKEFIAESLLARGVKDGKLTVDGELSDCALLKGLLLQKRQNLDRERALGQVKPDLVFQWQALVPENLRNGQLEDVKIVDGLFVLVIKHNNVLQDVQVPDTAELAGRVAQVYADRFSDLRIIETESHEYLLTAKIGGDARQFKLPQEVATKWLTLKNREESDHKATTYLLGRIKADKLDLIALAQKYINDLGRTAFIERYFSELSQIVGAYNIEEIQEKVSHFEMKESIIHDISSMSEYLFEVKVHLHGGVSQSLNIDAHSFKQSATAQYKEIIWNDGEMLKQISQKKLSIDLLAEEYLGKTETNLVPSEMLCKLTHVPAKKIKTFSVQLEDNAYNLHVTFKDDSTESIKLTKEQVEMFAISQHRKEIIANLPKQTSKRTPRKYW